MIDNKLNHRLKPLFRQIFTAFTAVAGMAFCAAGTANAEDQQVKKPITKRYANEKVIEFKANSGATTEAVEGFLMVPENRNAENSRNIRLNYVRFPSTSQSPGSPIIYLSGGPGGSGIGTAKWRRFPLFEALRAHGDVIALDQRGAGASEKAPHCTSSQRIEHGKLIEKAQVKSVYQQAAKECLANWQQQGVDVYGYTTLQNALDIEDLRRHFKAEKVSLWGISYGSHLALAAMKYLPDSIDKVIIASAEGLNQTVKLPAQTDNYFQQVQKVINQQTLSSQVPDLSALMKRVHAKLKQEPQPLNVQYRDGSEHQILLQEVHMKMLASMVISDPNQYLVMLIQAYITLDNGDTSFITRLLGRGIFKDEPIGFELMALAMDVASGITEKRLSRVQQQAKTSLLEDYLNFPMPALNKLDSALDLGDNFRADFNSTIPTLLLTGTLDGRTYPEEQLAAVKGLQNVAQVKVINAGHNLYTASPEVLARMQTFLAGKEVSKQPITLPVPNLAWQVAK